MLQRLVLVAALVLCGLTPAKAYTPESGTWWNPAQSGWGILIEIQDNFLFAAVYTYEPTGPAIWYTATGFLSGNSRFVGVLDGFRNGPCLSCPGPMPNTFFPAAGGSITIDFDPDDPTRARLAWGGRTNIPIERYQFYLKRPEDEAAFPGVRIQLTKMLGEWRSVLDFSENTSIGYPYYGDIAIFDILDSDNLGDFLDGCRPDDSLVGVCSSTAVRDHRATMEYNAQDGEHILVLDNDASTFAAYFLRVGTNHFEGEVSVYNKGSNPSVFYPVRGYRSASRTFVQGEDGPSKSTQTPARRAGLPHEPFLGAHAGSAKRLAPDKAATLARLEARLADTASREAR
ncbi:MAG: hypothetical protein KDJ14_04035 [Xanthomonadales bacterium]|nr:hypothetical protein [Xanthomonadales bacterium]